MQKSTLLGLSLAAALLAACASGGSGATVPDLKGSSQWLDQSGSINGPIPKASRVRSWMALPDSRQKLLYVSNEGSALIDIYDVPGYALVGQISGINQPEGIAVDHKGNLYVTDLRGDKVWIFKSGQTTPFQTITDSTGPEAIAVAPNGNVLVGDDSGGVNVYPAGQTTPSVRLSNPNITYVSCVGVDSNNNVFAGGFKGAYLGTVVEYQNTSGGGTNLGLTGLQVPSTVLFDAGGNLVVSDYLESVINIYPPGQTAPSSTIPIHSPDRGSFSNTKAKLYVPQATVDQVSYLRYPRGNVKGTVAIGGFVAGTAFYPPGAP